MSYNILISFYFEPGILNWVSIDIWPSWLFWWFRLYGSCCFINFSSYLLFNPDLNDIMLSIVTFIINYLIIGLIEVYFLQQEWKESIASWHSAC